MVTWKKVGERKLVVGFSEQNAPGGIQPGQNQYTISIGGQQVSVSPALIIGALLVGIAVSYYIATRRR